VRAAISVSLAAREGSLPTTVWLDDFRLRPWSTEPMPNASIRTFSVGEDRIQGSEVSFVADDYTATGHSALANPRFLKRRVYIVDRMEISDLSPGAYRVDFRIRVAPTRSPDVIFRVDGVTSAAANFGISFLDVRGTDLQGKSDYREIPLTFIALPGGRNSFRVLWFGAVSTWVDSITLTEERLVDAAEFDDVLAP
jgi:hypothetical protein